MLKLVSYELMEVLRWSFRTSMGLIVGFTLGMAAIISLFDLLKPIISVTSLLLVVLMKFFLRIVTFFLGL